MNKTIVFTQLLMLVFLTAGQLLAKDSPALPASHTIRNVEGWNVRVDDRLLTGEHKDKGERALKLLTARLVAIDVVMPEASLEKIRQVVIQLDLDYGKLTAMQYHPDKGWLKRNGYNEDLAKCVHIPSVDAFLSPYENHRMPWVVLHELAHAYHDQFLGFDNARIQSAWDKFKENQNYQSVLTSPGHLREHYALTNPKEFFAEMTEAYFGSNDFYPFVTGELKKDEPEVFALMQEMWGNLPGR
ncbi:metallopeptidase [Blastopirellula marina]|uniref:Metallopeptidase n=1 Tax=Blastopirellula marina TaxID=124 RepID=A0A2S8FU46_9BACT|nr:MULTISPECIES: metallopeptidase [Pirellulaceae]PQO35706.1 metallopeptidase [Blastopirellula marina]RCS53280.1 metallopeptidase [Bremerella cremea]